MPVLTGCPSTASQLRRPYLGFYWGVLLLTSQPITDVRAHEAHGEGQSSIQLETLVVTADRLNEYAENNPTMVQVLGRKEMTTRNILSVEEALNTMAGVEVKPAMGVGSRISIRGSGKSGGVLVLLNGRPFNSNQYGSVDLASIPIETIESITVFKPPVPVWLGTGASEGAISIVTKGIIPGTKEAQATVTKARSAAGSYGVMEASISNQQPFLDGTAMASATGKHRDGKRTNSDLNSGNFQVLWNGETAESRKLELDGRYSTSEYGSPGPLDNPTPNARQRYDKASLDSRVSGMVESTGDYTLNLYGDSIRVEDKSQSGPVSTLNNNKVGLKGEYNWSDQADQWALRTSTILEQDNLDHNLTGNHTRTTAGLGMQADRKWLDWTLTGGARVDQATGFGCNPALSGGVHHVLGVGWVFKANLGYSVNIPTFGQLYQPSHGSIDQTWGNPDLDKEKTLAADTGLEYRWAKDGSIQFTLFRSQTDAPILYRRGSDLIYRPVNGDRSWRQGMEISVKHRINSALSLDGDLIVQDSEVEETGTELTYTPHLKAKLTLQATVSNTGTRLEATLRYTGRQYTEMENIESQRLDAYTTVDCKAIQPFKLGGRKAEWFLNIENLFDTGYAIHYGYPDDGFRILTGLNVSF